MKTISDNKISTKELKEMSKRMFGNLVKAVVDIEKEVMVVDAELHSDEESILIETGSLRHNLWGINLHPDHFNTDHFIEYDSMINVKPFDNNPSRDVLDPKVRARIQSIIAKLVV